MTISISFVQVKNSYYKPKHVTNLAIKMMSVCMAVCEHTTLRSLSLRKVHTPTLYTIHALHLLVIVFTSHVQLRLHKHQFTIDRSAIDDEVSKKIGFLCVAELTKARRCVEIV